MAVRETALATVGDITRAIRVLRGRRVLLDAELAVLHGVTTRRLDEQVRRNRKRFPGDFLFELTAQEFANLKSQFATSSWGDRRKPVSSQRRSVYTPCARVTGDSAVLISAADRGPIER
jgi:ORF6N domain-containing protein